MSTTPPTISPRSRSRESGHPTSAAAPALATYSKLRVVIRLPHIAAESKRSNRFQIAVGLLAALRRSYAAAAFIVFLVAMVAMLLHGKSGETPRNDRDSAAPRWNSAVTVPAAQQPPPGRQAPAPTTTHSDVPLPQPAAPFAQSAVRQAPAATTARPALPPIATASNDPIPNMPRFNPSRNDIAEPGAPWRRQLAPPPGDPSGRIIR
jgi:hypothetical protein